MDSIRHRAEHVAEVVRRSPQLLRKKLHNKYEKITRDHSNHEELSEDWLHQEDALVEGITFYVKSLGFCLVDKARGQGCTDSAVKKIVQQTKLHKLNPEHKLQKVCFVVAARCIKISDMETKDLIKEIPIYRISYCTADPYYPKVFALVAREAGAQDLFCHAYLCQNRSMAQAIALTVAQAFNVAFDYWETVNKKKEDKQRKVEEHKTQEALSRSSSSPPESTCSESLTPHPQVKVTPSTPAQVVDNPFKASDDTNESAVDTSTRRLSALNLEMSDDFDSEFTRLAESRSNPSILDTDVQLDEFQDNVTNLLGTPQLASQLYQTRSNEDLLLLV